MNSLIVLSVEVQALLVTSPGSARLHESQCTQHLHNLFHECLTESRSLYEQRITVFFKLRFPREILRARRTGMEVTKAFPVLHDLLVTSPGSARLHVVVHLSASTHAQFLTGMYWEWNVV